MKKDMPVKGYQLDGIPTVEVFADGPTSAGGVRNVYGYGFHINPYTFDYLGEIRFQQGHPESVGINGVTLESVLAICLHRLNGFQRGPYPSAFNAMAIGHIEQAIAVLQQRQQNIVNDTKKKSLNK